ncbi:hypothetical protein ABVT39_027828 [Epinephelus coioides]
MAEQQPERSVDLDQSQFCCSVCLDLLKEPVTVPCGHSYCKSCIEGCWDEVKKNGKYSCPQCRETFSRRPVLRRNNMLAEVVEMIKRTGTQLASPAAACAGPADVACDFCRGTSKNKATMSCLTCLASYCPVHLEPHHSVPVLKKHQLVSATIPLQEKMCTKHNKLMEVYCGTDKKCICYLCVLDEHKGHGTVSAAAERAEEQKQLIVSQKKVQERFQKREKELNELLKAVKDLKNCTQPAVKSCNKIFDELISSLKKKRTLVKQLIEAQEQTAVAQADELQLQLEKEIINLKKNDTELEQLSQTDDHIHFIQTFKSLFTSCETPDRPPGPVVYPQRPTFKPVTDCVSALRDDIESLLKDKWPMISATVSTIDVVPPVPKTRMAFLRYCRPLTLDGNSVSQYFSISEECRRVTSNYRYNSYGFSYMPIIMQVLCKEGLSGRCYWEFITMAEQQPERGVDLDQSQFCCSVCLDLLKEPVAVPCGHSYCKSCIEGCWDEEEKKGKYSCPQCRETFSPRPVLRRNNMLAEVVEMIKRTGTQLASPAAACAGPADVACDFCCGTSKNKATMSCLTCLASYCPVHLEPHHSVPVLKKHQLVSATIPLQEKMCTKHNKLMEVYCRTDKKCICYLCVLDEHKSHGTVSAAAERAEEQEQLIVSQKKVQERFQKREKELNELLKAVKDLKNCTQPAVKSCDKIFDELISSLKKKRTLVKQLIEAQEQTAVAQADELQLQLEEEITSLKKNDTELEQLSQTDDHIHFIQTFKSLSTSCETPDRPPGPVVYPQHPTFKPVTDCVSALRGDIESLLKDKWPMISATVSTIDVVPPVPKTREEFLRYCRPLTLDGNSVSQHFSISEECRRLTSNYYYEDYYYERKKNLNSYSYSNTPSPIMMQVLCKEGLSGRCYWEVSWDGNPWSVAVSYKDSSSTNASEFGNDNKSWSLNCSTNGYTFQHNSLNKTVRGPRSSKIGVYLDYKAGMLSFYSISGTMTLLHKEHTTFTQPLYPGLELKHDGSLTSRGYYAELIKLW